MRGRPITTAEIEKIIHLRQTGHSLPEIRKITQRGGSTVFKYIEGVEILPKYQGLWKIKRGGSKSRALQKWLASEKEADILIPKFLNKEIKLVIAACLYWAEGAKKDFSLSNTDPSLIKIFLHCLKEFFISKNRLRVSLRIYEDIDRNLAVNYWARTLGLPTKQIRSVNILKGRKKGKLQYGMCRIRIAKGGDTFKLLQSLIKTLRQRTDLKPL